MIRNKINKNKKKINQKYYINKKYMNKILIYEKLNALHTHTYIYNAIVI